MPLFVPTPAEEGGKYGYAAMAGLGLYVLDIRDPGNMKRPYPSAAAVTYVVTLSHQTKLPVSRQRSKVLREQFLKL